LPSYIRLGCLSINLPSLAVPDFRREQRYILLRFGIMLTQSVNRPVVDIIGDMTYQYIVEINSKIKQGNFKGTRIAVGGCQPFLRLINLANNLLTL